MNVTCPKCQALYRVDPERVPPAGARVRCARCAEVFRLTRPAPAAAVASTHPGSASGVSAAGVPEASPGPPRRRGFGAQDPDARAHRIARALVSDIVAYHPERRDRSLTAGTLRSDFREEILKSWEEYVAQVGNDLARRTPHFRQALNEILAKGQRVF